MTRTRKIIAFLVVLTIIIPIIIMFTNPEAVDDMMDRIKIQRTQTAQAASAGVEATLHLNPVTPMPPRRVTLGTVREGRTCASLDCPSIGLLLIYDSIWVDGLVHGDEVDGSIVWYRTDSNRRDVDAFVNSTWIVEGDALTPTAP